MADGADLETGLGDGDPVDEESACVGLVIVGDGDDPVASPARRAGHKFAPARIRLAVKLGNRARVGIDGQDRRRLLIAWLDRQRDAVARGPLSPCEVLELVASPIDRDPASVRRDDEQVDGCVGLTGGGVGE